MTLPTAEEIRQERCGKCGERFRVEDGIVMYMQRRTKRVRLAHVYHFFPKHSDSDHLGLARFGS